MKTHNCCIIAAAVVTVALLLGLTQAAWAEDIYLDAGDELQTAIDAANSGDTLYLAAGTFQGGFSVAGKTLTIIGTAVNAANWDIQTALDGQGSQRVMVVAPDADVTLCALMIENGFSALPGGGVLNLGALTVLQCEFAGCYSNLAGGALMNSGTLEVDGCAFVSNSGRAGGAIANGGQFPSPVPGISAVIANSDFRDGFALLGGAIWNVEQLTMANDVLVGNTALAFGGGLLNVGGAGVYNCTFSLNGANVGGGICNGLAGYAATLNAVNCILWQDTAATAAPEIGFHPDVSVVGTVAYSDVEGGIPVEATDGGGNVNADPQLVESAYPAYTSPCINTGDDSVISAANGYPEVGGQYVDMLGNPRISGGVVDMGAVELQSVLTVSDVTVTPRNDKVVTVTVQIGNPNEDTAYDVTVTAASLDGSDSNSPLPLVYGAIKPGTSKKCTLQFKEVPSGDQPLTVRGTSSLGAFVITQTVLVP
jgi:hypothetical protein